MATLASIPDEAAAAPDPLPNPSPDPLDMTRAQLYVEDRWQAPFAQLRREAPVYRCETSSFGPLWSVSSYQAIEEAEVRADVFSSAGGITVADPVDESDITLPMFIAMDRPKHTEQRRTVAPKFTPTQIDLMRDDIRRRSAEVLDSLPVGHGFDWVDKVSIELTTQMLAILFDFPWEDRRKLTFWSDWAGDIELVHNDATRHERLAHMFEMGAYFKALWDERLTRPGGTDLLSMMVHSDAMSEMDQYEFMGNLILLIVGGNDTTRNTMSGLAFGLEQFPDQRAKLEADPALIHNTIHEVLRWQTPLAHMRRTALTDTELGGQKIAAGDKLALWYISGNRDESVFPDPDRIIVDRPNARRHLAFGHGIHRCVGARLAELQIAILLEEMAKRRLRVNVTGAPTRVSGCFVHGYRSLPVELSHY